MPVLTAEIQANNLRFALPQEMMEQLGLKPGDRVEISSEALKRVSAEQADQAEMQTKLNAFFERLEATTFDNRMPLGFRTGRTCNSPCLAFFRCRVCAFSGEVGSRPSCADRRPLEFSANPTQPFGLKSGTNARKHDILSSERMRRGSTNEMRMGRGKSGFQFGETRGIF